MPEVRNAISKAIADGEYLRLDTTNDPLTGDLEFFSIAPTITFTDLGGATADHDWTIGTSGNDLTITNLDSDRDNAFLILDHPIDLVPNPKTPISSGTQAIKMAAGSALSPIVGVNIGGYFFLQDSTHFDLTGLFSSYGCINEQGVVTETGGAATTDAVYLFVNNMTIQGATGSSVPAVHSFDHRVQLTATTADNPSSPCAGSWALQDWSNAVASGTGSIVVEEMGIITNRPFSFGPTNFFGVIRATGASASVTVNNRYGALLDNIIKDAEGGTETLVNDYGIYIEGLNVADTISCAIWTHKQTGATNNYSIVLDGDGIGADIRFGDGQDSAMYWDASNLIIDPDYASEGTGKVYIGATGDDDLLLTNIEIDGDIDHDGSNIGFFGTTPTTKQTALTTALTDLSGDITPGTPDYVLTATNNGWGCGDQDEFETMTSVIKNLQDRVNDLESKLQAYGLLV